MSRFFRCRSFFATFFAMPFVATLILSPSTAVAATVDQAMPAAPVQGGDGAIAAPDYKLDSIIAYGGRVVPPMESARLPLDNSASEPRKWDRALPFFAQRVVDKGIELPNPYDVGLSLYVGAEDRDLSNLSIGIDGRTPLDASFVQFPHTRINNQSLQFQAGAWIFPFLSVYGIAGYTQGKGDIDIAMSGRDLMGFLGVPGCNLGPALRPELCDRTVTSTAHADYSGTSIGAGLTLAGAYKDIFFSLPITYVEADTTVSDTNAKTWDIAPRVGWNQHLEGGMVTWYAGGTYMISKMSITGSVNLPTAGTAVGKDVSMQYSIEVEPSDAWNYLAGAHWMVSKSWSLLGELGFGGSRQDVILAAFYRF